MCISLIATPCWCRCRRRVSLSHFYQLSLSLSIKSSTSEWCGSSPLCCEVVVVFLVVILVPLIFFLALVIALCRFIHLLLSDGALLSAGGKLHAQLVHFGQVVGDELVEYNEWNNVEQTLWLFWGLGCLDELSESNRFHCFCFLLWQVCLKSTLF